MKVARETSRTNVDMRYEDKGACKKMCWAVRGRSIRPKVTELKCEPAWNADTIIAL